MNDLYKDLGVDPDSTPEEIKAAYKKKAKTSHPDAGGDEEEFKKHNKAFMVLSDPDKRKHYDQTGEENPKSSDAEFRAFINSCVTGFMSIPDPAGKSLKNFIEEAMSNTRLNLMRKITSVSKEVTKTQSVINRIKAEKETVVLEVLRNILRGHEQELNVLKLALKNVEEWQEKYIMDDYEVEKQKHYYRTNDDAILAELLNQKFGR